jgi:hypothetical protein
MSMWVGHENGRRIARTTVKARWFPGDYPRKDSEVRAMEKKSAEDVLKKTFEQLDKVVNEKKAEKDAEADRGGYPTRAGRTIQSLDGDGKTEKAVASVRG